MNIARELIRIAKQLNPPMSQRQRDKVRILEENGNDIATWDAEGIYMQGIKNPNMKYTVYSNGNSVHGWKGNIG